LWRIAYRSAPRERVRSGGETDLSAETIPNGERDLTLAASIRTLPSSRRLVLFGQGATASLSRLVPATSRTRAGLEEIAVPSGLHAGVLEEMIMSALREGGCACGAIRYRLGSDPLFIHCCHCLNCQRQTGSAFVINLMIEADRVETVDGVPQPVGVPRDDGSTQRIFRCPNCQVAVFSEYGRPEVRYVRAGTLDRPSDVTPDVHIFTRSKVDWITIPESTPAFEIYYDMTALWPAASLERLDAIIAPSGPLP
jgi:hypothetical protein